jgi:hypothetical protein
MCAPFMKLVAHHAMAGLACEDGIKLTVMMQSVGECQQIFDADVAAL